MTSAESEVGALCAFCRRCDDVSKFGKMLTEESMTAHHFCMLFSCALTQRGKDDEGLFGFLIKDIEKELRRGSSLRCTYCKEKGATIGCFVKKCTKKFHYPCGVDNKCLHLYFGNFSSYCVDHRPKSASPALADLANQTNAQCPMCLNDVDIHSVTDTITSACCKNSFFHRSCVQEQALNAGYFFKCPLCNNKKKYLRGMLTAGIYVPEQDASWELEENAFQDLLFRHNRCDLPLCLCPHGPEHNSDGSRWEIILCRTCGSQGCHIRCGRLSHYKPAWECSDCMEIRVPSATPKKKKTPTNSEDGSTPSCRLASRILRAAVEARNSSSSSQAAHGSSGRYRCRSGTTSDEDSRSCLDQIVSESESEIDVLRVEEEQLPQIEDIGEVDVAGDGVPVSAPGEPSCSGRSVSPPDFLAAPSGSPPPTLKDSGHDDSVLLIESNDDSDEEPMIVSAVIRPARRQTGVSSNRVAVLASPSRTNRRKRRLSSKSQSRTPILSPVVNKRPRVSADTAPTRHMRSKRSVDGLPQETLVLTTGCACMAGCGDKISFLLHRHGDRHPATVEFLPKTRPRSD